MKSLHCCTPSQPGPPRRVYLLLVLPPSLHMLIARMAGNQVQNYHLLPMTFSPVPKCNCRFPSLLATHYTDPSLHQGTRLVKLPRLLPSRSPSTRFRPWRMGSLSWRNRRSSKRSPLCGVQALYTRCRWTGQVAHVQVLRHRIRYTMNHLLHNSKAHRTVLRIRSERQKSLKVNRRRS